MLWCKDDEPAENQGKKGAKQNAAILSKYISFPEINQATQVHTSCKTTCFGLECKISFSL